MAGPSIKQLQQMAEVPGINQCRSLASQSGLIRIIQDMRGEEACFATGKQSVCTKINCEWSEDCRELAKAWFR